MLIAKVTIPAKQNNSFDQKKILEIANEYLSSLILNGQIWGDFQLGKSNGILEGYVTLPEKDAIDLKYTSSYGKSLHDKLKKQCREDLKWSFLTDNEGITWENWKESNFLFLRTNFLDNSSPVNIPKTVNGVPVPLYLIPIEDELREYIYRWCDAYRAHDQLWIGSGVLEMMAYEQITNMESDLSIEGRDYCSAIEHATGIPTYYYQYRYFGYFRGEENRSCPICGKAWRQSNTKDKNFKEFQFKCESCRIVSHEGDSKEDDTLACIGDFRGGQVL